MSSFKDTDIVNPGTPTQYGADDMELISRLFNGVASGIPPVRIKSDSKWGFWDGILYIRNQADTQDMTIRGPVTMTSDFDLTLPSITGNDSIPAIGIANIWSQKQQLEAGTLLKEQDTPPDPASQYHHLYVNNVGHLIRRDSTGEEFDYDSITISGGGTSLLPSYTSIVYRSGSTYFAYKYDGTLITSSSSAHLAIQAALDLKGTVLLYGGDGTSTYYFDITAGIDIKDDTTLVIDDNTTIRVPQGYTGYAIRSYNTKFWEIDIYGQIIENGTVSRNWTGILLDSDSADVYNGIIRGKDTIVYDSGKMLHIKRTSAGSIYDIHVYGIGSETSRIGIEFEVGGTECNGITFDNVRIEAAGGITTDGYKNVDGTGHAFRDCFNSNFTGSMNNMNIVSAASQILIYGGHITDGDGDGTFTDSSSGHDTIIIDSTTGIQLPNDKLYIKNTLGTFNYQIIGGAITDDKILNLPVITSTQDTIAVDGIDNFFNLSQTITDTTATLLQLRRDTNTVGLGGEQNFRLKNNLGNYVNYAKIRTQIYDNVTSQEAGIFSIWVSKLGTLTEAFNIDQNGVLRFGPNLRILFSESGLTGPHTYTLPDADGVLLTSAAIPPPLAIQGSSVSDFQKLYRNDTPSVVNNEVNLLFEQRDSANNETIYSAIKTVLIDNTNTSEDGEFQIWNMDAGTLTKKLSVDETGMLEVFGKSTQRQLLSLYIDDNTVGNDVLLAFDLESSTGVRRTYSRLRGAIDTNTNGSEDGRLIIDNMKAGSIVPTHKFLNDGQLELHNNTNTQWDSHGISFYAKDSVNNAQNYSEMLMEIESPTSGSEDSGVWWRNTRGGSLEYVMHLNEDGKLTIGKDNNNQRGVSSYIVTNTNDAVFSNSTAENTLLSFTVKGGTMGVDGHLIIKFHGYALQNQATGTTYIFRIKVGGTTIWGDQLGGTIGQSGTFRMFIGEIRLFPSNQSTTTARMAGYIIMNNTTAPTQNGQGSVADDTVQAIGAIRDDSIAWTFANDTTISMTCQMSVASSSASVTLDGFTAELAPS